MALLTDKETRKDLKERLSEFGQFGMVFNYMLDENSIDISDLERIFFDSDREKATLIYSKLLRQMKPEYLDVSYSKYSVLFPNECDLSEAEYCNYLNKCCLNSLLLRLSDEDNIDKTYVNTYSFLLKNTDGNDTYVRKR